MSLFKKNKNSTKKRVSTRYYKNKLLTKSSPFAITESFKKLRTNILYATPGGSCAVVAVTSAFQETGKSIIAANLAISFSQLGKRTLLIDCDLRKPAQHRIFSIENTNGMSEKLAGINDEKSIIVKQITDYENLSIITSGAIPPNPAELLASENMHRLVETLRKSFDIIIVDLPPINLVTDASVIAKIVDGYLFIVRLEYDDSNSVREAIDTLEQTDAKILGMVVNDISPKASKHYYSRYGKYGYKYYRQKKKYYSYNSYDHDNSTADSDGEKQ